MQGIFSKYGKVIVVVMAVVALIGILTMTVGGPNGGWIGDAFKSVITDTTETADAKIDSIGSNEIVMLDGDGQIYNKSLYMSPLSFRSSAPVDTFKSVKINGEEVDSSNYEVTEGSTIVTFKNDYIQSLDVDSHSIDIISGAGTASAEFNIIDNNTIPEDAYYGNINVATMEVSYYDLMPEKVSLGDFYIYDDYIYLYDDSIKGWGVSLFTDEIKLGFQLNGETTDKNQSTYGAILEVINNEQVTNMHQAFMNCTSLTAAPEIPSGVTDMYQTFGYCTSLITAPAIPSNVLSLQYTFTDCTALTTAPDLSDCTQLTNMHGTFSRCGSLATAPTIPNSVTNMEATFSNCTSLTNTISIPCQISVDIVSGTWFNCPVPVERYHYEGCGH